MISAESVIAAYETLTSERKTVFLLVVAHELTISARMHYEESDPYAHQVLIGINQLQHHLSSETRHLIEDEEKRYPDDVLIRILIEKATAYGIAFYLERAVNIAVNRIRGNA